MASYAQKIMSLYEAILSESKVLMHIDAFPGTGKTTLMHKLEVLFPDIVFKDLDDFLDEATHYADKKYAQEIVGGHRPEKVWDVVFLYFQKLLNRWIEKQTKPIILVGLHYTPPEVYTGVHLHLSIPTENKYLLKLHPLRVAWHNEKREAGSSFQALITLIRFKQNRQLFYGDVHDVPIFNKALQNIDYIPKTAKEIVKELSNYKETT